MRRSPHCRAKKYAEPPGRAACACRTAVELSPNRRPTRGARREPTEPLETIGARLCRPAPTPLEPRGGTPLGNTWLARSSLVLDPCQNVLRHGDELAALVHHLDLAARAALDRIDLDDGGSQGDGVADVDGAQEPHLVVAQRDGGFIAGGTVALFDHHRRAGGGEAQQQHAVGDALAVF